MSAEYENMQVEKWVNLEDVAEHLSLSQDTVRTWIKEGKLRLREFHQFGIEEYGTQDPVADAELISLASSATTSSMLYMPGC